MVFIWDYGAKQLAKTEQGRIMLLERMINYGPSKGEKIPLDEVRKYWDKLTIDHKKKQLLALFL